MSTSRVQTLADSVFAIVMTLLVFEMRVPESPWNLEYDLLLLLPNLLSFIVSFTILGVYWVGHHSQFEYIERADLSLIWLNIIFLMGVSLVPFSAGLLGQHGERQISVVMYGANLIVVSIFHVMMWRYSIRHGLLREDTPPAIMTLGTQLSLIPIVIYSVAILLSYVNTLLSILLYVIVPVLFVSGYAYRLWNGDVPSNFPD
jgi:uncharacterized membrane protein